MVTESPKEHYRNESIRNRRSHNDSRHRNVSPPPREIDKNLSSPVSGSRKASWKRQIKKIEEKRLEDHCMYCGRFFGEEVEQSRKPGCCSECYLENFASTKEYNKYWKEIEEEQELEDDDDLIPVDPTKKQRVDEEELSKNTRSKKTTQADWEK